MAIQSFSRTISVLLSLYLWVESGYPAPSLSPMPPSTHRKRTRAFTPPEDWIHYLKHDRPTHLRNRIATQNHGLVYAVVNSFVRGGSTEDPDELFQVGYFGLLKAIALYQPGRAEFSTFATSKIRGEIQHAYRYNWHGITGMRQAHERMAEVKAIARKLESRGDIVDLETIALNLMARERWLEVQRDAIAPRAVEVNEEVLGFCGDGDEHESETANYDDLRRAIALLPQKESDVLIAYWFNGQSLHQIVRRQGHSFVETQALLNSAIAKLRERLGSAFHSDLVEDEPSPLPLDIDDDDDGCAYYAGIYADCIG